MTEDFAIVIITLLFPLSACMLVLQVNPYHALVIRGILGAVAALIYALLGAADVALTEALVGTMLSITLYAVAVRSSLSLRLGILEPDQLKGGEMATPSEVTSTDLGVTESSSDPGQESPSSRDPLEKPLPQDSGQAPSLTPLAMALEKSFKKHHMRLELISYSNLESLETALMSKEVHATATLLAEIASPTPQSPPMDDLEPDSNRPYHIQTHVSRLYEIMQADLSPDLAQLTHISLPL